MRVHRDSVVTATEQTSLVWCADNLTMRDIYKRNITLKASITSRIVSLQQH